MLDVGRIRGLGNKTKVGAAPGGGKVASPMELPQRVHEEREWTLWKNLAVYPSGPGALSSAIAMRMRRTSITENSEIKEVKEEVGNRGQAKEARP